MLNMNVKLEEREANNQIIKTGIVGAGQMGRGMVTQMILMKGISPAIVADIDIDAAVAAFKYAGITDEEIKIVTSLTEAETAIAEHYYVATANANLIAQCHGIECAIDATGVPDLGAKIATDAIENGKNVVMLNVETDVVIGPYLHHLAQENGVIYTGSAGDEPGAVMELYCFAKAMGLEVKVMGKGKNNKVDKNATPETCLEEATRRKMSPKMLCSFKDGTKTMVELTAMSNATGLIPDVIGAHGIKSDVKGLNEQYKLEADGGVLSKHGVVEYVDGIAPGVFVTVSTDNEEIAYQMQYHSMGEGPLWTLFRPYHLCNLETPLSVAKAIIDNEPTIIPKGNLVSECITVAKRDLKVGEKLDGIGGYTAYGSIATYEESTEKGYVPFGLVNSNAVMLRDVAKGEILTYEDVKIDESTLIYSLRQKQEALFNK